MKAQWPSCPVMPYLTDRAPHQISSWDRQRRPVLSACQSLCQDFPQLREWLHPSGHSHTLLYTLWVIFFLSSMSMCGAGLCTFLTIIYRALSLKKKKKEREILMKEKMTHTKKGVRERTPEERAFLKEKSLHTNSPLLPWQLQRFQHQGNNPPKFPHSFPITPACHLERCAHQTSWEVSAHGKVASSQRHAAGQRHKGQVWDIYEISFCTGPATRHYPATIIPCYLYC